MAATLGVYAGLLGTAHGIFEILQGTVATGGVMINAIGAPCQAEAVWHACLPAMTLVPNFLVTGALAVLFSLLTVVWAAFFVGRKRGGLVLILLSITMLLIGGGFIAPFVGLIAGVAGTKINAPFTWWRTHLPGNASRLLAKLWPWLLIAYFLWIPTQFLLGRFSGESLVAQGAILLPLEYGLLLLTLFAAFAYDIQKNGRFPTPGPFDQRPL